MKGLTIPPAVDGDSGKDGEVGVSDNFPGEFPLEEAIVPLQTRNRATAGIVDQDSRQVAPGTYPRDSLITAAGTSTEKKQSKDAASKIAEEFPSENPVVVLPSTTMTKGIKPPLRAKLSRLELQQPVEGSASYARSSILGGNNQVVSSVPGAFPVPGIANQSNLATPYGTADVQTESEERVFLEDNLGSSPPASEFITLEAERVQEYDIVEAHRVDSVAASNEAQRPLKWHQKKFYRVIVIGSILIVGAIIAVVVLVTNSNKQLQATASAPTQAPTVEPSTLEQIQVACDFLGESLATCRNLTSFTGQAVGTTIPSEIALLTQLTTLVIGASNLGGTIPSSIGTMIQLEKFSLDDNQLTGIIPFSLGDLTLLTDLSLFDNSLNGTIPLSITNLTKLRKLTLEANQLTGSIPSSLGDLTLLTDLSLAKNSLNGTIPLSMAKLTDLLYLWLYNNHLSGSISTIGSLIDLQRFSLSSNSLTGTIPDSFGSITRVAKMHLDSNALTGSLPTTFGSLNQLTDFRIFNNSMTSINFPSSLCSTGSDQYLVDCPDSDSLCSCCSNKVFNSNSCS
jgi:hypothetical protein